MFLGILLGAYGYGRLGFLKQERDTGAKLVSPGARRQTAILDKTRLPGTRVLRRNIFDLRFE